MGLAAMQLNHIAAYPFRGSWRRHYFTFNCTTKLCSTCAGLYTMYLGGMESAH